MSLQENESSVSYLGKLELWKNRKKKKLKLPFSSTTLAIISFNKNKILFEI